MHLHRQREDVVAPVILAHVDVEAARSRDLLELTLGPRGATEVLKLANGAQHGRQGDHAGFFAEAGVRADAVVDVGFDRAVDPDFIWIWEDLFVSGRAHERDEDLVVRLDVYFSTTVIDCCGHGGATIRPKGAIQADSFHGVVKEFFIRLWCVDLCQPVNLWQVNLSLGRKVVINDLCELEIHQRQILL